MSATFITTCTSTRTGRQWWRRRRFRARQLESCSRHDAADNSDVYLPAAKREGPAVKWSDRSENKLMHASISTGDIGNARRESNCPDFNIVLSVFPTLPLRVILLHAVQASAVTGVSFFSAL